MTSLRLLRGPSGSAVAQAASSRSQLPSSLLPQHVAGRAQRQTGRLQAVPGSPSRDMRARTASITTTDTAAETATTLDDPRTVEYNRTMQQAMHWELNPYEYHPQRGLYWHEIVPGLICGTQPRNTDEVQALKELGVTHILNLQTDKDMQYWGVNIESVKQRCAQLGITHMRHSARDFDPHSLRKTLPSAVAAVSGALVQPDTRVYVHCTAGLGRAPAVCIAYMFWFLNMDLDQAYKHLTDLRPCGPKRDAIRGATYDLLSGSPADQFERLGQEAWAGLAEEDKFALQWKLLKMQL